MSRDYDVYLEDILEAVDRIQEYVQDIPRDAFEADRMRFDAVIRNLEIIGEAVRGVPDSVRQHYSEVEWRKIAGLRDILIHRYFSINVDIVWDVVESKLPTLKAQIQQIIKERNK